MTVDKIISSAYPITLELLKAQGLTESNYKYYSIQNTLFDSNKNNEHVIAIGWPDGVYCFFKSSQPIELNQLFPNQLATAYRNASSHESLIYDLR